MEYRLFGAEATLKERRIPIGKPRPDRKRKTIAATAAVMRWSTNVPLQVRGMVLARNALFAAGPPDVVDEARAFHRLDQEAVHKALARQSQALGGSQGAILYAADRDTGAEQAAYRLESPPVWDGLAASGDGLFLADLNGAVSCFRGTGSDLEVFAEAKPDVRYPERVGHWSFEDGKGAVAKDSSEWCNDANVRVPWAKGKFGNCLSFGEENGLVQIPESESLNIHGAITLMAWIKPDEQTAEIPMVIIKNGPRGRYILRLSPKRHVVALFWRDNERTTMVQSRDTLSKEWHHVAVTCDAADAKVARLYVDGELVNEVEVTRDWGNPAGGAVTLSGRGKQQYRGLVDEVRIYSRALAPDEVRAVALNQ